MPEGMISQKDIYYYRCDGALGGNLSGQVFLPGLHWCTYLLFFSHRLFDSTVLLSQLTSLHVWLGTRGFPRKMLMFP